MNDELVQVGGTHYGDKEHDIYSFTLRHNLGGLEMNVLKYIMRKKENRLEDLHKARNTLARLIEWEEHKKKRKKKRKKKGGE